MEPVVILSKFEQEYLLRAIEASVQVRDLRQFYLWTQGQLQALLPHQLMLCMQFDGADALVRLECLHAGVLGEAVQRQLCDPADGLALRLARHCRASDRLPALTGGGRRAGDATLELFRRELQLAGFDNLVVHGSGRLAGAATLFALCGWKAAPSTRHAYFLALLLPHLHMALLRLSESGVRAAALDAADTIARPLSARETEILGWVREGKSNYEVGCILGISALTVKNHLQRIYRTLGVSNRTHALSRCMSLHLFEQSAGGAALSASGTAERRVTTPGRARRAPTR
ncbi:helix-turn-helix transcriptional regulator [Massilia eurypsychrophila]|uniref:Helix-turn-helix transcriptional regulator n=1 Tax=Massilia eurypsychrophila TaxID=1485217 RepID=A0A2G8TFD3_9BURK|nr:XrtB/PEP-CTERM-associated transcriptional regulator EpsA [Massilia eurypsychrophila]PIL44761.1 helix-turn-helix transcriptional regulator [Massilia eurypsychrophila]